MQHRIPYRRVLSEQNGYCFHFYRRFLFRLRDSDPVLDFGHPLNTGHRTHDTQRQKNSITFRTLLAIHLNRIPSKFLPGGVWQTFARVYDMNGLGITKTDISLVVLYENTYFIILAAIVSTLGIYLYSSNELYSTLALALFLGSIATIPLALFFRKRSFIL
jgi:hypothetical protein